MIHELRATAGGNTGAESVRSPQTGPAGEPAGLCEARVRCYAELNDHLPERWHQRDMPVRFAPPLTLAELLAALGLSTDAVELALIDGSSVDLDASVPDGARVSLYPAFEAFDIGPIQRLHEAPLRQPRFLCDAHLDKLGRRLRLLGFDTVLAEDATGADPGDDALVHLAREQHRILLSRDRELLARPELTHALEVPQAPVDIQLRCLIQRLQLQRMAAPFTRCTCCNALIEPVDAAELRDVPQRVRKRQERFWRCPGCERIYWEGSHHRRMRAFVDGLLRD
jgi:hypothetical protein